MYLNRALTLLEEFIRELHRQANTELPTHTQFPDVLFVRDNLGGLMLWESEARSYRACLKNVWSFFSDRDDISVSLSQAESLVQTAILRALDINNLQPTKDFDSKLKESLAGLRKQLLGPAVGWIVHIQIRGVDPTGLPFSFGGIEFFKLDEPFLERLQGKDGKGLLVGTLRDRALGTAFARLKVTAVDLEAARLQARRRLQIAIDVLNFYSDIQTNRGSRLYLPGEGGFEYTLSFEVEDVREMAVTGQMTLVGSRPNFLFSDIGWGKGEAFGLSRLSEILEKDKLRTKLEDRILSSAQWAGRATMESRKEEAFLLFAIAMEALMLGTGKEGELNYRMSIRAAHLLMQDSRGRKDVRKDLGDLYRTRSKIVHSGSFQVTDTELSKLRVYVKNAIVIVLTTEPFSKMTTEAELDEWFEAQVLFGTRS